LGSCLRHRSVVQIFSVFMPLSASVRVLNPFPRRVNSVVIPRDLAEDCFLKTIKDPTRDGPGLGIRIRVPSMVHEQRQENDDRKGNPQQPKKCAST
jgi:hypothetical protein